MAKLIYSAIASLDGHVEDKRGRIDWAAPDDEVLAFINDLERPIGTYYLERADADRARVRPRRDRAAESVLGSRHLGRRGRARRDSDCRRSG